MRRKGKKYAGKCRDIGKKVNFAPLNFRKHGK